jgi:hypothetical protein
MSEPKRRRFLSANQISELVWDNASEEDIAASSEATSEDDGGLQEVSGVTHLQPDRPTFSGQASSSSKGTSASECIQTLSDQQWIPPSGPQKDGVHIFTWEHQRDKK